MRYICTHCGDLNGIAPKILYNKNFHLPHNFLVIKSVLSLLWLAFSLRD